MGFGIQDDGDTATIETAGGRILVRCLWVWVDKCLEGAKRSVVTMVDVVVFVCCWCYKTSNDGTTDV